MTILNILIMPIKIRTTKTLAVMIGTIIGDGDDDDEVDDVDGGNDDYTVVMIF